MPGEEMLDETKTLTVLTMHIQSQNMEETPENS